MAGVGGGVCSECGNNSYYRQRLCPGLGPSEGVALPWELSAGHSLPPPWTTLACCLEILIWQQNTHRDYKVSTRWDLSMWGQLHFNLPCKRIEAWCIPEKYNVTTPWSDWKWWQNRINSQQCNIEHWTFLAWRCKKWMRSVDHCQGGTE